LTEKGDGFHEWFWMVKDSGHVVSSAIMGAVAYLLIGAWALRNDNPLAMVLTVLGAGVTDAAWRVMGAEISRRERFSPLAITLAIASWVLPTLAVMLLVFFRTNIR